MEFAGSVWLKGKPIGESPFWSPLKQRDPVSGSEHVFGKIIGKVHVSWGCKLGGACLREPLGWFGKGSNRLDDTCPLQQLLGIGANSADVSASICDCLRRDFDTTTYQKGECVTCVRDPSIYGQLTYPKWTYHTQRPYAGMVLSIYTV